MDFCLFVRLEKFSDIFHFSFCLDVKKISDDESSSSSSSGSGTESSSSSSTEELSPTVVRRVKRRVNKVRKNVKNLRVLTKHVGRTIKLLYPQADVPDYSPESMASAYSSKSTYSSPGSRSASRSASPRRSRSKSSSRSHSRSSSRSSRSRHRSRQRTEHLQGHERGAPTTGKTKLDNNLTSWWSKYKGRLRQEKIQELYDEFNFRPGQKMTLELRERIKAFRSRLPL